MPAGYPDSISENGSLSYVFNEGVEGRDIFGDRSDYEIFLSYLKDYLSPVTNPEKLKKTFVVKGKSFKGLPRQPKNYLDRVELLVYRLRAGCFHLLVNELVPGSLEQFMRSLLTRYSIYYNKKYKRRGSLFSSSYKVFKPSASQAVFLSYFLHRGSLNNKPDPVLKSFSSYAEYLGLRQSAWVRPDFILSYFGGDEKENFKEVVSYQDFVEKYELNPEEKRLLEDMVFEKIAGDSVFDKTRDRVFVSEDRSVDKAKNRPDFWSGVLAFLISMGLFLVLFGLGVRNIQMVQGRELTAEENTVVTETVLSAATSEAQGSTVVNSPEMSSVDLPASDSSELVSDTLIKTVLKVRVIEGLTQVNIRRGPTVESEKIGSAQSGDAFEFVSESQDWYEIKLTDGTVGFVSAAYTELFIEAKEGTN